MRHLLTILAVLFLCSLPAQAQTLKAVMYNTNGQVVYNSANQLRFTNEIGFASSGDIMSLSDLGIAFTSTNSNTSTPVFTFEDAGADKLRQNARENLGFSTNLNTFWTATNAQAAARALSGSTNTNHPFSGTVSVVGTNNTNTLTFSNGILQSVQ